MGFLANTPGLIVGGIAFAIALVITKLTGDMTIGFGVAGLIATTFACYYDRYPQGVNLQTFIYAMSPVAAGATARVAICVVPLIFSSYFGFSIALMMCVFQKFANGHNTLILGAASVVSALITLVLRVLLKVGDKPWSVPLQEQDDDFSS